VPIASATLRAFLASRSAAVATAMISSGRDSSASSRRVLAAFISSSTRSAGISWRARLPPVRQGTRSLCRRWMSPAAVASATSRCSAVLPSSKTAMRAGAPRLRRRASRCSRRRVSRGSVWASSRRGEK
jgi:hypothetical protein